MKTIVFGRNSSRVKRVFEREFGVSNKPDRANCGLRLSRFQAKRSFAGFAKPKVLRSARYAVRKPLDFVVSYGGDGTLLHAERIYPDTPKLALRSEKNCGNCIKKIHYANGRIYCGSCLPAIVEKLKRRQFTIEKIGKIQGTAFTKKGKFVLEGLNEVQVHSTNHIHAVRFDFFLNGKLKEKEVVGDGLVAATSFGSTAYFHAISRKSFKRGFGIAFNNPMKKISPLLLGEKFVVEVRIKRRNCQLIADNNPKKISLSAGDRVVIKPSKNFALLTKFR